LSRDFTYIDDIIEGIVRVIGHSPLKDEEHPCFQIFNIGNSQPIQLMDFIHALEDAIGKKAEIIMQPMQQGDVYQTYADMIALENYCGYAPETELRVGICQFVNFLKIDKLSIPDKSES
jgi:UDP-glucuronate 4-epimerase